MVCCCHCRIAQARRQVGLFNPVQHLIVLRQFAALWWVSMLLDSFITAAMQSAVSAVRPNWLKSDAVSHCLLFPAGSQRFCLRQSLPYLASLVLPCAQSCKHLPPACHTWRSRQQQQPGSLGCMAWATCRASACATAQTSRQQQSSKHCSSCHRCVCVMLDRCCHTVGCKEAAATPLLWPHAGMVRRVLLDSSCNGLHPKHCLFLLWFVSVDCSCS